VNVSLLELAVAHDVPVAHRDAVAAHADDPLDEGLLGLLRVGAGHGWSSACWRRSAAASRRPPGGVEGDDVADLGVRAQAVTERLTTPLADVERPAPWTRSGSDRA
jgi:hypothetical protein